MRRSHTMLDTTKKNIIINIITRILKMLLLKHLFKKEVLNTRNQLTKNTLSIITPTGMLKSTTPGI